ncbi:uncharacterized protein LOC110724606 [Chenopodium quinoa]|nr:uncharacterized protein LOC110724606 [Chenopodium quinoa]
MDYETEKSHQECYNIPKIRDFWKKYKSHATKRYHHDDDHHQHKHHISSNNKIKPNDDFKTNPHDFDEEFFKATQDWQANHEKLQDVNHHFHKVNQNGNEVEELNKMSQKHGHDNDNYYHNNCFKAFILLSVAKKKKGPSQVSSLVDLPKTHNSQRFERNFPKGSIFHSSPSLGRSGSINTSRKEQGTKSSNISRAPSTISRAPSTTSRTTSINGRNGSTNGIARSTSDAATKARKMNVSRSGPMIMFSNSSGMLKPPATEKQLECTLEELYHGCVKHIKVSRDVFSITGQIVQEEEVLTVNIKPGWKTGTRITFQGAVKEERQGEYPGDIIFVVTEKHHPLFRRKDDDLELEIEIPMVDALTGCNLYIPLLGKDKMSMRIDEIIYPGYEKTFVGQGMPNQKNPHHKGNLKVKFLVAYPNSLTDVQRSEIFRILSN